tara:strand:- start:1445 stop:1915 length:471 start_codon:yes stop_codon:yes gene_type:complete
LAWEYLRGEKLTTTADILTVDGMAEKESLALQIIGINSGQIEPALVFNNDTATNYSQKLSVNGGSFTTTTGQTNLELSSSTHPQYANVSITNFETEDKLVISGTVSRSTAGAAYPPDRWETVGEWDNSSDYITRIDIVNNGSGDFDADTEVIIFGA